MNERQALRARLQELAKTVRNTKQEEGRIWEKLRTMSKCGGFDDPCGDSFECTKCYRDAPGWGI